MCGEPIRRAAEVVALWTDTCEYEALRGSLKISALCSPWLGEGGVLGMPSLDKKT